MNSITNKLLLLFTLAVISQACRTSSIAQQKSSSNDQLYEQAVLDAMAPSKDETYDELVSINPTNKDLIRKIFDGEEYILMVSWKSDTTYYKSDTLGYYNTGNYQIWVTAAPELRARMQHESTDNVDMRLKQLLGLPPDAEYRYIIEFWVKPRDMFRPCPDNEITDDRCGLCFPAQTGTQYISWFNEGRIDRYYQCELDNKYPWTQLGYTYDWNPSNNSHVGLSEFVIDTNKKIIIKDIYTTEEYLNK